MLQILDLTSKHKQDFFEMVDKFYNSDAVLHKIDKENILNAYNAFINKEDKSIRILILKEAEKVIGYSVLAFYHSLEAGGKVLWIEEIFIEKEFRGKGYFSKFFKFLKEEYAYVKRFRLEATKENERAIAMYKKLDYLQFLIEK